MDKFRLILKYLITLVVPLICLKLTFEVCKSHGVQVHILPLIGTYIIIALLLFLVFHWRFKKAELIILFLPLLYTVLFCCTTDFYMSLNDSPLARFIVFHWSNVYNSCMIFAAYLTKFLIEVVLNIKNAIESRKETTTKKTEEA